MSKLAYLIALLVGLASFQTASAVGCLYADVFEKKWRDSDEPQDIYSIKLTQEREGLQINFLQSTTNEFLVKVYYNAGGFLPAVSRLDGSLVEVNINGLLYLLPGASSHMSAELSLLLAGAAHAAAFQDGKKCATLLGAAYFLTKIIGVHAQVQSCPIIKVEIYSPPGRCKVDGYDTSLEGYWLVDCPLPPTPPTTFPTRAPTYFPTTSAPSPQPTTATPTLFVPTEFPTRSPTKLPTVSPTHFPTRSPTTSAPTTSPSRFPTPSPTLFPTLSCRSYAQLGNNCSDRDDCYEAALDPGIFEILLSSPDIDATTKQLLQAFLSLPNCYTTSEIPNLCLSLDTGSCENAVSDGYCTDVSVFQYESVKWLDGYDRPGSNCFPMTAVGICEQQTNLQDCNATIEQFLEFERECLWLDYGSGNTVCRSPGNFSTSECAGLTEQSCDATEPVCTYDGSCLENCVYHASQPACESHPDCQWLSKTVGSPFCSLILRFPAEDCIGLTQASCNAALTQKVNPSDGINITANACVYNTTTSSCRAVDITALAEVSCHPAHSKVQVEHEGFRRIEEVHVGQNILSDVGFEPIIAIIHSEKAVIPFYYHIETDDFAMDVARGHLIMANGQPKDPKDIKKGDVLETMKGKQQVREVSLIKAQGAYHIYTASGNYYIDGILSTDKHGFDEWNSAKDLLFNFWKLFVQVRYTIGLPIVNDNKMIWVGDVMRTIDTLPSLLKVPIGLVFGSFAFVYGNVVTLDVPVALIFGLVLYYTKASKA